MGFVFVQECREITPGDLLPAADACVASGDAGGVYRAAGHGCRDDDVEHRTGEQGAEARDAAAEYGAGGVLGDGGIVYVACGVGFDFLAGLHGIWHYWTCYYDTILIRCTIQNEFIQKPSLKAIYMCE